MARYGMVMDLDRCIGCYNCQIACKDEHVGNDFPPISKAQPLFGHFWMSLKEIERKLTPSRIRVTTIPVLCQQCNDAPCEKAAKDGAITRRADGIVIIDPIKARGQKQLVAACPYGAIYWNEEQSLAQKCSFCAHLLDDGWREPRCVQTCPAGCMNFGDLDDPQSKVAQMAKAAEPYHAEFNAKPNVLYLGLPKRHVSGRVLLADKDEWASVASVSLISRAGEQSTSTDAFGEFDFAGVDDQACTLRIQCPGYRAHSVEVKLERDITYVGDIALAR